MTVLYTDELTVCFSMRSLIRSRYFPLLLPIDEFIFVSRNHEKDDVLMWKLCSFLSFVLFELVPHLEQPRTFTSVHFTGSQFSVS